MFLGLRTAIYHAADLASAKRWYAAVLGVEPYFDQPFYVGFRVGGFELGLDPDGAPAVGALWGVAEIGAAFDRLTALGAVPVVSVTDVGSGIKVATVRDPFGNLLGLIENPHFQAS